jgi:hypothetical protein
MATMTAIIVLCEEAVLIWAIPPLLPQPPDLFNHNPTHIPLLFTIPFPYVSGIGPDFELILWNTISSWYFGSSHPLYFDKICRSIFYKFQITLKTDFSAATLQVINTFEPNFDYVTFDDYKICEDTLVSLAG